MHWKIAVHQMGGLRPVFGTCPRPRSGAHPVGPRIHLRTSQLCALPWCALGPVADTVGSLAQGSWSDLAVLSSLHSPGLGPVELWDLVRQNRPWQHTPELALSLVGSGGEGRGVVTRPHTRGDALGVHYLELLANHNVYVMTVTSKRPSLAQREQCTTQPLLLHLLPTRTSAPRSGISLDIRVHTQWGLPQVSSYSSACKLVAMLSKGIHSFNGF